MVATNPVPHLTTALNGPLHKVESLILARQTEIESWFRNEWRRTPAPFYASVDLRNAGYKIAPVDTNLFPAGFNNLNPAFASLCIQAIQQAVEHANRTIDRIMIIPENHTRNRFYLQSISVLKEWIEKAGFEVRLGSLIAGLEENMDIVLDHGRSMKLETVLREGRRLTLKGFVPDMIILNNDLSAGRPELLEDIEQLLIPPLQLGWSNRLKSVHFEFYRQVAQQFGEQLDMDPWLIHPMSKNCGEIDFMNREGESCLSTNVATLLAAIREKYCEYNISCQPFVMIKADAGTYGMGVMTAHSVAEVSELNRKQRTRMATAKEGRKVSKVIIQEGVYTHETWGDDSTVAEPVVYMIDHNVVGGFYRVHNKRGANENLNSPGMRFERLAFDDCCISPDKQQAPYAHPNRFYTYGVIARLALLAAAREAQI